MLNLTLQRGRAGGALLVFAVLRFAPFFSLPYRDLTVAYPIPAVQHGRHGAHKGLPILGLLH